VKVTNGIIYYYQVSATNEKGEGKLSQLKSGTPYGRPGRVINLTVVGGDIFIIVSWSPPLDRIQYIKGYIVHKLNTQSGISLSFLTGDTIFYDDDVKNGVEYLYSVSAYTEKGECERGESIRAIPYTIPGPVTNLAQASGDRYVSLNWNAPVETGYSILQKYKIYRGVSKNTISFMTDTIDEFYNDTSVQNGITYFYRITAANQYKESPAAETNATPFSPPGPPEDFKLTGRGEQICLSWDYPLDAGGSMVFEYVVYRGKSRDSMKPVSVIKGYEYVDNATKNGNVNYYMVSARNMNGEGVPSDILTMETKSPSVSPSPQYILYLEVLILIILLLTIAFFYKRLQNLHEK
jgi:fibronectin type 3 domain-containing protein